MNLTPSRTKAQISSHKIDNKKLLPVRIVDLLFITSGYKSELVYIYECEVEKVIIVLIKHRLY